MPDGGKAFLDFRRRVVRQVMEDGVPAQAARLSYYFLLAIFPLLLFLTLTLTLLLMLMLMLTLLPLPTPMPPPSLSTLHRSPQSSRSPTRRAWRRNSSASAAAGGRSAKSA